MAKVFIFGTPFEHALSSDELEEALTRIKEAGAFAADLREQLLCAVATRDLAEQWRLREQIASHPHSKLYSTIRANRRLHPKKRQPLEICLYVSFMLDFSQPLAEEVVVCPRKKNSEGYKPVYEFDLWYLTSQDIVLRTMECYLHPHGCQHTDVPSAIRAAKFAIQTGSPARRFLRPAQEQHREIYYTHLKISRLYESIEQDSSILPLSRGLIEHVVFGRHFKVKGKGLFDPSWAPLSLHTGCGLPRGSICSPIVGAFTLSRLEFEAEDVFLINLDDDFLLISDLGYEQHEAALDELVEAITRLPGGHFVPKEVALGLADQGIDFLGHQLQFLNGTVKTTVSRAAVEATLSQWKELERRISRNGLPIGPTLARSKKLLARMFAFAQGWRAEFVECDDVVVGELFPSH